MSRINGVAGRGLSGVVMAAAMASLPSCKAPDAHAQHKQESAPVKVSTVPVEKRPMPQYMLLTGSVSAWQESEVAANASGKVLQTFVERGQRVKKGDMLARLDASSAALVANAARAQAHVAGTQAEQAKIDCSRAQSLFENKVIAEAEYQRMMAQCTSARFSHQAAEANQAVASKNVADSSIRAPFDGVVGERFVSVGEFVQPSTRIASVYDVDPLRLEVTVPEASIGVIRNGMNLQFEVAAFGARKFPGIVKFVSPNIRRASRDLVVEAEVPNADGALRPGMFATVRLLIEDKDMPVVPSTALRREESGARLFAIVDGRVHERVVQAGVEKDGMVAVVRGVSEGDRIVIQPGDNVRDGVRVEQ